MSKRKKRQASTSFFSSETITLDRFVLIISLMGVIVISASIGFIFGVVAAPLDANANLVSAHRQVAPIR